MMSTQQIALWADRLRDIAAQGMHWSNSRYDVDRYRAIQTIAMAMLAAATGEPAEALEPLRATVFSHVTPFAVGDAAVIDDEGRILLIQRADNAKWAIPKGGLSLWTALPCSARRGVGGRGDTGPGGRARGPGGDRRGLPGGGARRRVRLAPVRDTQPAPVVPIRLLVPAAGRPPPGPASHAHEVLGARWFAEDALPSDIDPGHVTRIPVAFRVWHNQAPAFFDP